MSWKIGSSPLARGGRGGAGVPEREDGLIPAGAGRTDLPLGTWQRGGAHPRWRGEDGGDTDGYFRPAGSSPLARGGPGLNPFVHFLHRLIPAGAGRTAFRVAVDAIGRAHPRWRGEDLVVLVRTTKIYGSSPLARGGPTHLQMCRWAGGAHPRWRGEDGLIATAGLLVAGSSPLARGGPGLSPFRGLVVGLIPAGAGRTPPPSSRYSPPWAHPRWRGEDVHADVRPESHDGSSPLVRGGHAPDRWWWVRDRLIPAGAGRTPGGHDLHRRRWAHPRWRGEDDSPGCPGAAAGGSSPLARGGP